MYTYSQIHSMTGSDVSATFGLSSQAANALRQAAKGMMNAGKGGQVYTPRGSSGPAIAGVKQASRKEPRTSELANGLLVAALNAALYGLGVENTKTAVRAVMEDETKRAVVATLFASMPGLDPDNALAEADTWAGVRTEAQRRQEACERLYRELTNAHQAAKQQLVAAETLRKAGWHCEPSAQVGLRLKIDTQGCEEAVSMGDLGALAAMADHCGL